VVDEGLGGPLWSPGLLPDFPAQVDVYWATLAVVLEKKSGTGYARDPLHPFGIMAFKGLLLLQVQVEEVDHSGEIHW